MARTNIYRYDEYDGKILEGWFDPDACVEDIDEERDWNGDNSIGRMSGGQTGYEKIYRTKGGRWVRYYNFTREYNGPEYHEFLTDDQAREWLLKNGNDNIAEKYFGELEEETGPGRPPIGGLINVRLGDELLTRVNAAALPGEKRAETIRRLLEKALESE